MKKIPKPPKPGFVRVMIPARNRTLQIRENRARNKKYLADMGMIVVHDPELPPAKNPALPPPDEAVVNDVKEPKPKGGKSGS